MRGARMTLVATVGLLALGAGATAHAAPEVVYDGELRQTPVLAGDKALFVKTDSKLRDAFYAAGPGEKPKKVLQFQAASGRRYYIHRFDASASLVGYVEELDTSTNEESPTISDTVFTWPFTGAPTKGEESDTDEIGVSGNRIAFDSHSGTAGAITVREVVPGGKTTQIPQPNGPATGWVLGGKYVAFKVFDAGGQSYAISVVDTTTGVEAFRVPADKAGPYTLSDDGVLAIDHGRGCAEAVTWWSAAQPTEHAVPNLKVCDAYSGAGGQVLALRNGAAPRTVELVSSDLAGNVRVLDAIPMNGEFPTGNVEVDDFTGTTALYTVQRCTGPQLRRVDVSSSDTPVAYSPKCPIAIGSPSTVKVTKSGRAIVDIRCSAGGCPSPARVELLAGKTSLGARRFNPSFEGDLGLAKNLVDVKLTAAARKQLNSKGKLSATLAASSYGLDGKRANATKKITLVAAK